MALSKEAKEARNAYQRERYNVKKQKAYMERYWEKKAKQLAEQCEKEAKGEN